MQKKIVITANAGIEPRKRQSAKVKYEIIVLTLEISSLLIVSLYNSFFVHKFSFNEAVEGEAFQVDSGVAAVNNQLDESASCMIQKCSSHTCTVIIESKYSV